VEVILAGFWDWMESPILWWHYFIINIVMTIVSIAARRER
jgi:hypothetical protein